MWNIRTNYPDGYDFGPTNERTLQMKEQVLVRILEIFDRNLS
jgi:hypothetical protein